MSGFFILQRSIKYNLDKERVITNPIHDKKIIKIDKTNLIEYKVKDRERPDHVSINFYNTPIYAWTILYINNMKYSDWPLSQVELETYINKKYGQKRHETAYWKDSEGRIYYNRKYPKAFMDEDGNVIDFFVDKDKIGSIGTSQNPNVNEDFLFNVIKAEPVTYEEMEREKNEKRKLIKVIRPQLIEQFVKEYEKL